MSFEAPHSLALALKQFRTRHGLTQDELAERSGVSARSISDLERGISKLPHKDTIVRIAATLDLSPEETDLLLALAHSLRGAAVASPLTPSMSNCPRPWQLNSAHLAFGRWQRARSS
jgi:transcriptional regulator with XRE-family HTH domain